MERRKFCREFELEAVRLIRDRGVSYTQAARDLSVHQLPLRWSASAGRLPIAELSRGALSLACQAPPRFSKVISLFFALKMTSLIRRTEKLCSSICKRLHNE